MDAESILTAEFDADGHVVDFRFAVTNVVASQVLRKPMVELLGHTVSEVFPSSGANLVRVWAECLASGVAMLEEIEIDTDTEHPRWIRQQVLPLGDAIAVTSHDITDRRRAEADLRSLAHQDPLTELPNRRAALDGICASLERNGRRSPTTVLFVDLDRFKTVNDTFGHAGGDDLLRQIASRLGSVLRAEDMVARFGGDEFVVCLDGSTSPQGVLSIIDKLVDALRVPFRIGDSDVAISASIGVATSHPDWSGTIDTANLLVHQADIAAYEAKRQGRDQVAVFDEGIGHRVDRAGMLVRELRTALSQGNLEVHFQAQVHLESRSPVGLEALVRWNHPEQGLLSAAEFLPLAEDAGLTVPLGRWVRQRGMESWKRSLGSLRSGLTDKMVLWFKVSPTELHSNFIARLIADVAAAGFVHSSIGIEMEAQSPDSVFEIKKQILGELRDLDFRIALTEVSVNHAGISALNSFAADVIKLERVAVRQLGESAGSTRTALLGVLSVLSSLSTDLGMQLCAEGIESEAQLAPLRDHGFVSGAGNHLAPVVSEQELAETLENMFATAS
jgi:diguanylate cyclase (GGDEF)-like protein